MDFLKLFNKKAKEKNWLNFFLTLLEFLSKEELKWKPDIDDQFKDTFNASLPTKDANSKLKIIVSIVKSDDTHCTINVEYHKNINIMGIYCIMEELKTELHGFYKYDKNIEAVVEGEENKLLVKKFKDLHDRLIRLRLGSGT